MLNDRKITDWTQPVSSLDDRPQMTASALKAAFDSNTNQLKPAVNGMIDDLTGTTGAGNIGVEAIAGVTGTTVQAMLAALKALIDLCDTEESVDDKLDLKADKTTTDKLIKTVSLNAETGVFTFTTDDGTQTTIDTMLEKIPVNCYLDGQEFVLVLDDGTEQRADLSDFLTPTEFTDSSTIDFSVSGSTVTATIKNGSVTLAMLESTVLSTIQGYVTAAQTAAGNASTSEANAGTYRDQAQTAATNSASSASEAGAKATLSQSWAIGGTGTRTGEDTNNSKYFSQRASTYATNAQGYSNSAMEQADLAETYKNQANSAADRAEQAAEDAEAIAGGDFIPISQKGASNGVASLDATGKLEESQKPDYTASEVGAVPTSRKVNGKALSADITLSSADIGAIANPTGGEAGQILTKTADGAAWSDAPDTGVTTFNSRTGAVMPQTGDYTADMVGARPDTWMPTPEDVGAIAEPDGGASGQILTKADSGAEWSDPPETGAPLQGLPTSDIRTYPVREGQSISAGDVVNVGREIVSGTTYGDLAVGSMVQINENGSPVDYIVVHQGNPDPDLYDASCDGTWLLRKDIAEKRVWDAGNVNQYASSDINAYLNGDWLDRYDIDTLGKIKQVKIPYCVGNGSSTVNSGESGLSVKAFLLGCYEVGWSADINSGMPEDGAKLDYFIYGTGSEANQKRRFSLNGSNSVWTTRSPFNNYTEYVERVGANGAYDIVYANESRGILPCVIFNSSALTGDSIVYGPETVYRDVVAQDNVENVIFGTACTLSKLLSVGDYSFTVCSYTTDARLIATTLDKSGKTVDTVEYRDTGHYAMDVGVGASGNNRVVVSCDYNNNGTYTHQQFSIGSSGGITQQGRTTSYAFQIGDAVSLSDTEFLAVYNNSGLCVRIGNTSGNTPSYSSQVKLSGITGASNISAARLPDEGGNKRVCICFSDTGDSNKGKAVIATIDSSNAVTFGDVVTITSGSVTATSCASDGNAILVSTSGNLFLLDMSLSMLDTESGTAGVVESLKNSTYAFLGTNGSAISVLTGGNIISKGENYAINNGSATNYPSLAAISDNQVLAAYADAGNSSYGTTTILTVEGNQIAGSFLDNSSDAIALADGTGGQEIPVGFGGYCECPGVTEGDTIDSSGVSAYAVQDGWLDVTPSYKVITGTFIGDGTRNRKIDLGLTPKAVLVMSNTGATMFYGSNEPHKNYYGGLALPGYSVGFENASVYELVKIVDGGFSVDYYDGSQNHGLVNEKGETRYYIAWR